MTTTNTNENKNIISEIETMPIIDAVDDGEVLPAEMPAFENHNCPVAEELADVTDKEDIDDIDIACDVVNNNVKKCDEDIKEEQKDAEKEIENRRIASRSASIERAKAARRARKKLAKNMTFIMAIISALCSTIVIGIMINIFLDVSEWLFAGVTGAVGMLNTLIHTYVYRYIREEIFRK